MEKEYSAPHEQMEVEFDREGKVTFLLTRIETALLRSLIHTDIKMSATRRKKGLRNTIYKKYLMISGIIKTIFLSIYSQKAMGIFSFFAINKQKIREINKEKASSGKISVTFRRA